MTNLLSSSVSTQSSVTPCLEPGRTPLPAPCLLFINSNCSVFFINLLNTPFTMRESWQLLLFLLKVGSYYVDQAGLAFGNPGWPHTHMAPFCFGLPYRALKVCTITPGFVNFVEDCFIGKV